VAVDEMRVITNRSTGTMGRILANAFFKKGAKVTLLEGLFSSTSIPLEKGVVLKKFFYYDELKRQLAIELKAGHDIVVHAAAVADFQLARPFKGKISSGKKLTLDLVPTAKLVVGIKKASPKVILVGFKLETTIAPAFILKKTRSLFDEAHCDVVVANTQKNGKYSACLIWPDGRMGKKVATKKELVRLLLKELQT
jgi:phosphopantothenoylcysteine decarboxylase / phosphopantothenate---cysteine ligase